MEKTKNQLTPAQSSFFLNLRNFLDTPIYFFGSIQRFDYIPGYSDIDALVFTDNFTEMKYKLTSFFKKQVSDFKRIVKHIGNQVFVGYKIFYKDLEKSILVEVSVFSSKDKEMYLKVQREVKDSVPLGVMIIMYIVKLLYYRLQLISNSSYKEIKAYFLNQHSDKEFVSID
jgi:predicted nucleotidyltransferase